MTLVRAGRPTALGAESRGVITERLLEAIAELPAAEPVGEIEGEPVLFFQAADVA